MYTIECITPEAKVQRYTGVAGGAVEWMVELLENAKCFSINYWSEAAE